MKSEEGKHLKDAVPYFTFSRGTPQRRQWQPTPVFLPGESHGRRSLVGCSPWGREESDVTERLHFYFSLSCIGEGNGNPLQCPCLENPRDGGAWWAAVYGVAQSRTRLKRLSSSRGTPMSHRCGIHQSSWGPVGFWSQLHPVSLAFCPGLLSLQPLSKRLHMCTSEGYGIHNLKKPLANEG